MCVCVDVQQPACRLAGTDIGEIECAFRQSTAGVRVVPGHHNGRSAGENGRWGDGHTCTVASSNDGLGVNKL